MLQKGVETSGAPCCTPTSEASQDAVPYDEANKFHSVDSKNGGSQEATEHAPAVRLQ